MGSWKKLLTKVSHAGESSFDQLKQNFAQRLGLHDKVHLWPYMGIGTDTTVRLRGRVLAGRPVEDATAEDDVWDNVLNMYRYLESDEIAGARVEATCDGVTTQVTADDDGYFVVEMDDLPPSVGAMWRELHLTLLDDNVDQPVTAVGRVLIPKPAAQYGVISDIDDTVLQSNATNYLKAARLMFLQNARTRLPFAGVAAFYQMLQQGHGNQTARNPVFYVSSSPWNLYNLLTDFFTFQSVPAGPLFLKDYGIKSDQLLTSGHGDHKKEKIGIILDTYPRLNFILIGDSGQRDPEIYRDVVEAYPGRILAVYIRDVTDEERDAAVDEIAAEVEASGVPMVRVADSLAAAEHAVDYGFFPPEKLARIKAEMEMETLSDEDEALLAE